MNSCDVYIHLKPNFQMQKNLLCLNKKQRIVISRFRTNNTCLPNVTGRFKDPKVERHKSQGINITYCLNVLMRKWY